MPGGRKRRKIGHRDGRGGEGGVERTGREARRVGLVDPIGVIKVVNLLIVTVAVGTDTVERIEDFDGERRVLGEGLGDVLAADEDVDGGVDVKEDTVSVQISRPLRRIVRADPSLA